MSDDVLEPDEGPEPTPGDLARSGALLWESITGDFDLDRHELVILHQACRITDRLDRLAAEAAIAPVTVQNSKGDEMPHPALTESRQQSLALARLIASLRMPSGETEERPQRRGAARGSYGVRATP